MKIFIAGTFDNFHVGHQYLCWSVYRKDVEMVIVVARDKTVKRIKKRLPLHTEHQRVDRLKLEFSAYRNVKIRLGNLNTNFLKTIQEEFPTHLQLGYDQQADVVSIQKVLPNLVIRRGKPYFANFFKSSKFMKERL